MNIQKNYDVIVVGAGNGGLSAATYMAKAGKKVLLLEKHNLPGGCATSFVRGRFEFEATLHELNQMGENGVVRRLLESYGLDVDWVPINEAFSSISTEEGKAYNVFMPDGPEAFVDAMEKAVPGSRKPMEQLMEMSRMITDGVNWLGKYHNNPQGLHKVEMLLKYGDMMKVIPVSVDDMCRRIGLPDKAREIYESYWDYVSANSKEMSFAVYAYMTYTYLIEKPWMPRLRSHEIVEAFDAVIRKNGGEIWYNTEVSRIDVKNGSVQGVELVDGTYIPCRYVISNLMPTTVFGKMIDPAEVPERDKKLMSARRLAQSATVIFLGLDRSAEELGLKGYDTFVRTTGDNAKQFENMKTLDSIEYCYTVISNAHKEAYEPGTCALQFSLFYTDDALKGMSEKEYFQYKNDIVKRVLDHFEKVVGVKVCDHIEEVEVATPETWARYIGTPGGAVYGYIPGGWDGMFARVMSGQKLDYTIRGLRFVGSAGTHMDGYSQTYESGEEQARYMVEDMKEGK